jgi:hypothetical protein
MKKLSNFIIHLYKKLAHFLGLQFKDVISLIYFLIFPFIWTILINPVLTIVYSVISTYLEVRGKETIFLYKFYNLGIDILYKLSKKGINTNLLIILFTLILPLLITVLLALL